MRAWSLSPVALAAVLVAAATSAATEPPPARHTLDLYEWMAVAPIVVAGEVTDTAGRYVEVRVDEALRGAVAAGALVHLDVRRANRERDDGVAALTLSQGTSYLLLLSAPADAKADRAPALVLVRGTAGARELPAEGRGVWIEAARRLCRVLDAKDDAFLWSEVGEALDGNNPVLLDTALDLLLKFRRADVSMLPRLRALMADPRREMRRRSVALSGDLLARGSWRDLPDGREYLDEIVSVARRDLDPTVRVTATDALGAIRGPETTAVLREIAREDPEQSVRYAAERQLLDRKEGGPAPGTASRD